MLVSRDITVSLVSPVSSLSHQELRVAIVHEVLGWKNIRSNSNGQITGSHPSVLTTVPMIAPDWMKNESDISHLESVVSREVGASEYRQRLAEIAGDFNPNPSNRQRCEAALLAVRILRKWPLD